MTTGIPSAAASAAISSAVTGPPTRDGLTTSTAAARTASSSRAAATDLTDSSAAIGAGNPPRMTARSRGSPSATGCSTSSIPNGAAAAIRSRAVAPSHAPLASSRSRTSGPTAARTQARRMTRLAVLGSGPTFILIVPKPAATARRAAASSSGNSRYPIVALTATDWGETRSSSAESIAHRSARPATPAFSSSAADGSRPPLPRPSIVRRIKRSSSAATSVSTPKSSAASPTPTSPEAPDNRTIHDSR